MSVVTAANPIVSDRNVLRQSLLSSLMEVVERNARLQTRMALFEIGPTFMAREDSPLPDEVQRLAIVLSVLASLPALADPPPAGNRVRPVDFFIEPPTLNNLGFEWRVDGDDNRNASRRGRSFWARNPSLLSSITIPKVSATNSLISLNSSGRRAILPVWVI